MAASQRPLGKIEPFPWIWQTAGYFLYFEYGGVVMRRRGLRGVTLFLAISASVISACVCVLLVAGEYHSARFKLDTHDREYQGWQACRQMNPAYFEANKEAMNSCLRSLEDARDNFWMKRSTAQLAGLFIIVGLGSAATGYLATWGLVWLVGMGFHRFFRWLSLRSPSKPKRPLESQSHLHPDISAEY